MPPLIRRVLLHRGDDLRADVRLELDVAVLEEPEELLDDRAHRRAIDEDETEVEGASID